MLAVVAAPACSDDGTGDQIVAGPGVDNDTVAVLDGAALDGAALDGATLDGAAPDATADLAPDQAAETAAETAVEIDVLADGCPLGCPAGYLCFAPEKGPGTCQPGPAFACAPCTSDATCLGGVCSGIGGDDGHCLVPCKVAGSLSSCPDAFACLDGASPSNPGGASVCVPKSNSCTCSPANHGELRACKAGSGLGICGGIQACDGTAGWNACTAAPATTEVCNGLDDDCDGSSDEDTGGSPCGTGACLGMQVCSGAVGLACIAAGAATAETCNGVDDDCDGATDEAFKAVAETCDGLDDDCDGATDEGLGVGLPCAVTNGFGTCVGTLACNLASAQASCVAQTPQADLCNGADDDCNGATDQDALDPATALYLAIAHCGKCGAGCPVPGGTHALATCTATLDAKPKATCGLVCEAGWVDMDAAIGNGCECLFVADFDEPDGIDQDCDGIDGEIDKGVFVAKTGTDANPGTLALPVATVGKGLEIAKKLAKRDLYVAGGVYPGSIDLVAGVSLYGGYGPGFGVRDTVNHQTALVASVPGSGPSTVPVAAVRCLGIAGPGQKTRVDGFSLLGADAKAPGTASHGVHASGCDDRFVLTYNAILAGDGAPGIPGGAGLNGTPGVDGKPGVKARDIGHPTCVAADQGPGGAGGGHACGGVAVSGGLGGLAACAVFDEDTPTPKCPAHPYKQTPALVEIGASGQGVGAGQGGVSGADSYIDSNKTKLTTCAGKISCNTCVVPVLPRDGQDGFVGKSGSHGAGGQGGSVGLGSIVGGVWVAVPGGQGGPGETGAGGGGGGAAGGVEVHDCADSTSQFPDVGGSGGGGGSGGCGGTGGLGGGSGGGSFAVSIVAVPGGKLPILVGNSLASGSGGSGAAGGPAGSGGPGGQGGSGGQSAEDSQKTFCTSKGGTGGGGGHAGHGGGGGGGSGGPSAALVLIDAPPGIAAAVQKANVFKVVGVGGTGGGGGPSIGNVGQSGKKGGSQPVLTF